MANEEQLAILKQGVEVWNKWREENPDIEIDLRDADLAGAELSDANFDDADLSQANFRKAWLTGAQFSLARLNGADLTDANLAGAYLRHAQLNRANLYDASLWDANLRQAVLVGANLRKANLVDANLNHADLREADLSETNLRGAKFTGVKVDKAKLSGSLVHMVNVWDLEGKFEEQEDLVISSYGEPIITVDNIELAQFIYLILNNEKIRDVINTLTSKSVLILGRFADDERKAILNALRNKLREYNLLPIVFDFDRPIDRNITETVKTLAAISYFVIADITSPKSSPLELQAIVPDFQIPVVPIIQESELPFSMIADLQSQHDGVLAPLTYQSEETLIKALKAAVIDPAIEKHNELRIIKAQERQIRHAEDFIDDKGLDNP
jgi:hypothetical protein